MWKVGPDGRDLMWPTGLQPDHRPLPGVAASSGPRSRVHGRIWRRITAKGRKLVKQPDLAKLVECFESCSSSFVRPSAGRDFQSRWRACLDKDRGGKFAMALGNWIARLDAERSAI